MHNGTLFLSQTNIKNMEKDIVAKEAFKVLKRDFIAQMDHKDQNVEKALFPKYNKTDEEQRDFIMKIIQNNGCFTEMVEDLVQQTNSFEEFIIEYRMLQIYTTQLIDKARSTERMLGLLIRMDKDLEDHFRKLRDDEDQKG